MLPACSAQVGGFLKAKGSKWEILDKQEVVFIPSSEPADTGAHQTQGTWVAHTGPCRCGGQSAARASPGLHASCTVLIGEVLPTLQVHTV